MAYTRFVTASGTIESSGDVVVIRPKGGKKPLYIDLRLATALIERTALVDFFLQVSPYLVIEQLQLAPREPGDHPHGTFVLQFRERTQDYYLGYATHPGRPGWGARNRFTVDAEFIGSSLMKAVQWRVAESRVYQPSEYNWLLRGHYEDGTAFVMTEKVLIIGEDPDEYLHVFPREHRRVWTHTFEAADVLLDEGVGSCIYGESVTEDYKVDLTVVSRDVVELEFHQGISGPLRLSGDLMLKASSLMNSLWITTQQMIEEFVYQYDDEDDDEDDD